MFVLAITLLLGFFLRIIGLNWDQGTHLHPDERFLTMVAEKIQFPLSLAQYFNSSSSTFNPYNNGFTFYVYGNLPLLITRFTAQLFHMTTYDSIFLVGRAISALFDTGTIALVYFLSMQIFASKRAAKFAALAYCLSVLPIQQAHFFTVDSILVFFSTSTLLFFIKHFKEKRLLPLIWSGIFFGLTLASKTSLLITTPLFYISLLFVHQKKLLNILKFSLLFSFCWLVAFRIFNPYAFNGPVSLSPTFISNIQDAHKMITGDINYPPNVQWTGTLPIIHPLIQLALWGYGPVATLLAMLGVIFLARRKKITQSGALIFISLFSILIFTYQGVQLAKYMRYFYPIYPFLALLTGYAISKIASLRLRSHSADSASSLQAGSGQAGQAKKILIVVWLALLIWPICFISIYQQKHSRVQASEWIYENIPKGSTVTSEEWDDSLPLNLFGRTNQDYTTLSLSMFQEDSRAKWEIISKQLEQSDFIILSSNRVFDSITHRSSIYPITKRYYTMLFDGSLGFEPVKISTSFPRLGPFIIDDRFAEESFTVYDHPQVYIFKKRVTNNGDDIMNLLFQYEKTPKSRI